MKSIIYSILILSISMVHTYAEEKGERYTIWTGGDQIEESMLMRFDTNTAPSSNSKNYTHRCEIGYMRKVGKDKKSEFISILSLPWLKGDSYETKIINGKLLITTKNGGMKILTLNLKDLAPTLLAGH